MNTLCFLACDDRFYQIRASMKVPPRIPQRVEASLLHPIGKNTYPSQMNMSCRVNMPQKYKSRDQKKELVFNPHKMLLIVTKYYISCFMFF